MPREAIIQFSTHEGAKFAVRGGLKGKPFKLRGTVLQVRWDKIVPAANPANRSRGRGRGRGRGKPQWRGRGGFPKIKPKTIHSTDK